jgi:hypothetical protein
MGQISIPLQMVDFGQTTDEWSHFEAPHQDVDELVKTHKFLLD